MLIDTSVTIAYKCPICGSFDFFSVSLFKFIYKKQYRFQCRCGKSSVVLCKGRFSRFKITLPCIGCGCSHEFAIRQRELLGRDINVFFCPTTGLQQCFIGKDEVVRKRIDHLEKELDALIDTFGYDSYFKNTQVMLDSLNKIHDIAEQGNLHCECGNKDIELILFSDRIYLKCKRCSASKMISAASNADLKDVLTRQQIFLEVKETKHMLMD